MTKPEAFLSKIAARFPNTSSFEIEDRNNHFKQWVHPHSPIKPKKRNRNFSNRKRLLTVFWKRKCVNLVEFKDSRSDSKRRLFRAVS
ncbi:hypothetical protein NPIL_633231 [Nephila pilipes]|uniref:Uncharacterized protein n=1 Tax=Nephila pilipes TaxID=299642 RepID=A0A8X6TYH2_NEPPI|nr:hypothetical protein NPIL_633231 [Nephila pilipes]